MQKIRPIEIFLIEFIIFSILWLVNDYVASLLTVVLPTIFLFLLIISLLAEAVERSKVPRLYYYFMAVSVLAPILAALVFVFFVGADFDWLSFP